ncbi:MAG TPA: c-type cytochrome [Polyangia bacterium]|nr:c-type cytochrome [Polyangia bacterium]
MTARERTSFIGMAVFLGGWTMLFAALLFVWADVRLSSPVWPPDGEARAPLLYPAVATVLIAGSSWLLARGRVAATVICGLGFVAVQLAGLSALWRAGVTPSSGRYGSILYTFLALHGLHVVVGLAGLSLARAARRNWRLFWHFVGAVWLVLFGVLYLAGCSDTHTRGRDAYEQYCRPCHGERGDGRGYSSVGLRPPPRDFTDPMFKFGHVPVGALPPDSELERIVRKGLNGTAMLPWDVSDRELHDVVQYLKTFSPRWKTEQLPVAIMPSPDPFGDARAAAAVAQGKQLFTQTCAACHERRELKTTDFTVCRAPNDCVPVRELPPDLRCDPLRAVYRGTELDDLYRTIASGIAGAGMPTWKGQLPEDEIWAIVYYVRSLRADQTGCMRSRTGQ